MIRILFICHGNICRSTMAQFVMQDLINRNGYSDQFHIDSKATSTEELGNGPHRGTVRKMNEMGIPMVSHRATQIKSADYNNFDYIIGMDRWNYKNMMRVFRNDPEGKVSLLLDFAGRKGEDIADPWYTHNFDETYDDVLAGCEGLIRHLKENGKI
ncbi:MAG: low molecular weight phosphotyrosine protein phosphatase [Lachnospiraceae bacterium]|nr:low molecular weight phosphotyrosine protein phosphatase [Lachnospiraceae bacterium]